MVNLFMTTVLGPMLKQTQLPGPYQKLWACPEAVSRTGSYDFQNQSLGPAVPASSNLTPSLAHLLDLNLRTEDGKIPWALFSFLRVYSLRSLFQTPSFNLSFTLDHLGKLRTTSKQFLDGSIPGILLLISTRCSLGNR